MAQRHRFSHNRQHSRPPRPGGPGAREPIVVREKKAPVVYGKPFVVLEDAEKKTFVYKSGAWAPYPLSIAECKQDCQVKELPQKVNSMTRYEIRCPVSTG